MNRFRSFLVMCGLGLIAAACTTPPSSPPVPPLPDAPAATISAGYGSSCALMVDTTVRCWGLAKPPANQSGVPTIHKIPVQVPGLTGAVEVATGTDEDCARMPDGTVGCWGSGPLGDGTTSSSSTPVPVAGISNAVSLSGDWPCAALADGTVRCWGRQIGTTPVTVAGLSNAVSVHGSCAILADGSVSCWTIAMVAAPLAGLSDVVALDAPGGSFQGCAVTADGTAHCWGSGYNGQLGDGTYTPWSPTPVTVSGLTDVVDVAMAGTNGACASLADGTVRCWGDNSAGQLGNGSTIEKSSLPVNVSGLTHAVAVSGSSPGHMCALLDDGQGRCWGDNEYGQLGNGSQTNSNLPVKVQGLS